MNENAVLKERKSRGVASDLDVAEEFMAEARKLLKKRGKQPEVLAMQLIVRAIYRIIAVLRAQESGR